MLGDVCLHTGVGFLNENRVLVLLVYYDLFTACLHIRNSNPPLNEQLLYQKHDPQWLCCFVLFSFFVCLFWGESLGFLECYFILAVRATVANKELSLCSTTRLHSLDHGLFMRCFGLVSSSLKHLATSNTKIIVFILSQFTLF